ncbi:conserved hypothetical protein [Chlamydia felis Fe/C-56]|uniref:Uncharacterized protein n=1 Tax=Chlamydia felis (strain Fe/C-56) TaxID=264202 RepID=Q252S5_CHLFF|nr:hypothetical protein [Chlamydia felis]BAE81713.1 conserved hypothetical protein [Chlamydia felis Fe/C-56]
MGSPVSGSGGTEPPWKDMFTEKEPSTEGEGDDLDLEDRISDHVGSILDEQKAEGGIPEASASEGINSDLQGRVDLEIQEGFFRSLLSRIRRVATRIWYNRLGSPRFSIGNSCTRVYRELFRETELPEEVIASAKSTPESVTGCCTSIRRFFERAFKKMSNCICKRRSESSIDFCGADAEGPEGTIALALILRMATKWSAGEDLSYEIGSQKFSPAVAAAIAPIASYVETSVIVTRLESLVSGESQEDPIAAMRGIAKLAAVSHSKKIDCKRAIKSLSDTDPNYDYSFMLDLAARIDNLARKGYEETILARQILASLRVTHSQAMGEYLNLWGDDALQLETVLPVNYELVADIVAINLPSLEEAYRDNHKQYEKKLNDIIRHFFFAYETQGDKQRRLHQTNIEYPQNMDDEDPEK